MKLHRSGQGGLLVIGIMLAVVMATVGLAQGRFARQVVDEASLFTEDQLAQLAAESAVEEARATVALRLADPHTEIRQWTCRLADSADPTISSMAFDLGRSDLSQTSTMLASPQMAGAFLDRPLPHPLTSQPWLDVAQHLGPLSGKGSVHVATGPIITVPGSLGHAGEVKITLTSRVGLKRVRGVVRQVTQAVGLRYGPAVFSQSLSDRAVMVDDLEGLTRGTGGETQAEQGRAVDVNALVMDIVHRSLPKVEQMHARLMALLAPLVRDAARAGVSEAFVRAVVAIHERVRNDVSVDGPPVDHLGRALSLGAHFERPPFPDTTRRALLLAKGPAFDLGKLDLQVRIGRMAEGLDQAQARLDQARAAVDRTLAARDDSSQALAIHRAYASALIEVLDLDQEILALIDDFKTSTEVVIDAGTDDAPENRNADVYRRLAREFYAWDPAQMDDADNALQRAASWRIREDPPDWPARRTVTQKLRALLDQYDASGKPFEGMVYVDNPREPLDLGRSIAGRVVLAVSGGIVLDGTGQRAGARGEDDFVMVLANGATAQPASIAAPSIVVRGDVCACLALRGMRVSIEPGTRIVGSVLLLGKTAVPAGRIEGRVDPDDRIRDLDAQRLYFATLAPYASTEEVDGP